MHVLILLNFLAHRLESMSSERAALAAVAWDLHAKCVACSEYDALMSMHGVPMFNGWDLYRSKCTGLQLVHPWLSVQECALER